MTEPLLDARALTKRYGDATVVDALSFRIEPGECLGVIGPNWAGKTTTLRMCLGLSEPDSGEIAALGLRMPRDALEIKAQIGVVSQFDSLDPDFSCAENLLVYGRYFGIPEQHIRGRIPQLLEFAALTHKAAARPAELSGGMRRRLSLACTLVHAPKVIFLDEPTVGVDPALRVQFWTHFRNLTAGGTTILVASHVMDEADRCDELVFMRNCKVIVRGTGAQLRARAGTDSLEAAFLIMSGLDPDGRPLDGDAGTGADA